MKMINEFHIANHSSIVLFIPLTNIAQEWWNKNVDSDTIQYAGGYAVEYRFAEDIINAMKHEE